MSPVLTDCSSIDDDYSTDKASNLSISINIDLDNILLPGRYCLLLYKFTATMVAIRSPSQCLSIALRYIRSSLELPAVEIVLSDMDRDEISECYSMDRFESKKSPEPQNQILNNQSIGSKVWIINTLSDTGESKRKLVQFTSGVFNLALKHRALVYTSDVNTDSRIDSECDLHFETYPGKSMLLIPIKLRSHSQQGLLVLHLNDSWPDQNIDLQGLVNMDKYDEYDEINRSIDSSDWESSPMSTSTTPRPSLVLSNIDINDNEKWLFKLSWEISKTLGRSLDYSHEWRDLLSSREKADGLLALMQSLYADRLGIQSSVVALTTHAKKLIRAESCTVYIVDKAHHQLWSISSDDGSQVFKPLNSCVSGRCALTGRIISTHESDCDKSSKMSDSERMDEHYSETSDSSEHTLGGERDFKIEKDEIGSFSQGNGVEVVCMPIMSKDGSRVLAVIEAVNKNDPDGGSAPFTPDDIHLLEVFARIVGPQLELSDFATGCSRETEAGLAFKLNPNSQQKLPRRIPPEQCILEEEDET